MLTLRTAVFAAVLGGVSASVFSQTNQVLSLNGTSAYATIPSSSSLQPANAITLEAWIYPRRPTDPNHGWFIVKGDGQSVDSQRTYEMDWNHNPSFGVGIQVNLFLNTSTWAAIGVNLVESNWVHVAATYASASGTLLLYTNGILSQSRTFDSSGTVSLIGQTLRQTSLPVNLGGEGTVLANGYMDEVRIWNTNRTGAQIAANRFCRLSGTEPNLAAYWNFDGTNVIDLTGHGNNGTLTGGAAVVPIVGPDMIHAGACGVPSYFDLASFSLINGFHQRITGPTGVTMRIEASTNLLNWSPILTLPNFSGQLEFDDPTALNFGRRFYRAVAQ